MQNQHSVEPKKTFCIHSFNKDDHQEITSTLFGKMIGMKLLQLKQKHLIESLIQIGMEAGRDNAMDDMWKANLNYKIDSLVVEMKFMKCFYLHHLRCKCCLWQCINEYYNNI